MIRKYVLSIASFGLLLSAASCGEKATDANKIAQKWQMTIAQSSYDSALNVQLGNVDTITSIPEEVTKMYNLPSNLDSAKAFMKEQIKTGMNSQREQMMQTIYDFQKDGLVKVYSLKGETPPDTSNHYIVKDKQLLLTQKNPMDPTAKVDTLHFDIITLTSDSLTFKVNDAKVPAEQATQPLTFVVYKEVAKETKK